MLKFLVVIGWVCFLAGCGGGERSQDEPLFEGMNATAWIQRLQSHDETVRREAARALGKLGPDAAHQTVPALADAIRDQDVQVRILALHSLAELGPKAKPAIPKIHRAINDPNQAVLQAALFAMQKIELKKPSKPTTTPQSRRS